CGWLTPGTRRSSWPPAATTTLPDVTTNTPAETEEIGRRLGERLRPGDVVLLTGELGAGKTTLVRGVAQGIGSKAPVASPTFQLVRVYPGACSWRPWTSIGTRTARR